MLEDLKILNGKMSLKFDPLNTKYTIITDETTTMLDIEYKIKESDNISIIGNNLKDDYTEIIIYTYNEIEHMNYYLYVYKGKKDEVSNNINYFASIETPIKKEVSEFTIPCISASCFIIILILFTILFRRKKRN